MRFRVMSKGDVLAHRNETNQRYAAYAPDGRVQIQTSGHGSQTGRYTCKVRSMDDGGQHHMEFPFPTRTMHMTLDTNPRKAGGHNMHLVTFTLLGPGPLGGRKQAHIMGMLTRHPDGRHEITDIRAFGPAREGTMDEYSLAPEAFWNHAERVDPQDPRVRRVLARMVHEFSKNGFAPYEDVPRDGLQRFEGLMDGLASALGEHATDDEMGDFFAQERALPGGRKGLPGPRG